jgi:hypothetical protein
VAAGAFGDLATGYSLAGFQPAKRRYLPHNDKEVLFSARHAKGCPRAPAERSRQTIARRRRMNTSVPAASSESRFLTHVFGVEAFARRNWAGKTV